MKQRMSNFFQRIIRSPLLHFLVIGAVIYVAYFVKSDPIVNPDSSNTITMTTGEVNWLEDSFSKRMNRQPTPEERQGLIDQFVRETALYREAIAMGLDKDDVIIRRRLSQKLEFLFQDLADATPPTEEEIAEYFEANAGRYRAPEIITFTHVFIDPDRRGDQTLDDADRILTSLQDLDPSTASVEEYGDVFMLQGYYPERSEAEVAKLFGGGFAGPLFDLTPGQWHGPALSGYGVHLVYVHARIQPPPPAFEEVRAQVTQDLQDKTRTEFNDDLIAALLARYEVIIETPEPEQVVLTK
jgi:hypothetical protein